MLYGLTVFLSCDNNNYVLILIFLENALRPDVKMHYFNKFEKS